MLNRAKQLGDKLSHAWETSSQKVPWGFLDFSSNTAIHQTSNVAEAGTLTLEFDRLSQFTGNAKYRNLAAKSAKAIISASPSSCNQVSCAKWRRWAERLPWAARPGHQSRQRSTCRRCCQLRSASTTILSGQRLTASAVTWGGGTDSALEYFLKYALLTGNRDTTYLKGKSADLQSRPVG